MLFATRYGEGISRIVAAYQPGPMMVAALEALVGTIQQHAVAAYRDTVAQSVCEGMHEGPPTGLKCLACYEAEQQFDMQRTVQGEIEAFAAQQKDADDSTLTLPAIADEVFEVEPLDE